MDLWGALYFTGFVVMGGLQYRLIRAGLGRLPPYLRQQRMLYSDDEAKRVVGPYFLGRLQSCQWAGLIFFVSIVLSLDRNTWIDSLTLAACAAITVRVVWTLI